MAATSQRLPGAIAGAYRNTGTYGTPVWTEQTSVSGGSIGKAWEFADASRRVTRAKLYDKTQIDLASTLKMVADPAAADYVAFVAAAESPSSVLDLLLLNAKITVEGAVGVRSEFKVALQNIDQDMSNIDTPTFDLKPVASTNGVPSGVLMGAASSPTITAY